MTILGHSAIGRAKWVYRLGISGSGELGGRCPAVGT